MSMRCGWDKDGPNMCADVVDNDDDDSVRFCVLLYGGVVLGVRKFICLAAAHFHFSRMRRQYITALYKPFRTSVCKHKQVTFKHIQSLFIKTHDILSRISSS